MNPAAGGAASPIEALPPLREVIAAHGLGARKALGQHFLLDLNLTRRIARAASPLEAGTTIEIGPGPGGLTRALLLENAGRVVAVERDQRCLAALAPLVEATEGRLELIEGDARRIDPKELGPAPRRIVANLPYNVATPLLIGWLHLIAVDPGSLERLILMFQKEVADRLLAEPGTPAYGRLSVVTRWLTRPERVLDLPPRAFTPPPAVVSSVVRLVPRPEPLAPARIGTLERVTAAAFGQRRKMLRQALRSLGGDPLPRLTAAGVEPTARAETLTIEAFAALARAYDEAAEGSSEDSP